MANKVLKAKCIHCGKEVFSLYDGQLKYNIAAHELSCSQKLKDLIPKKSKVGK
jgi:hypothetical protein